MNVYERGVDLVIGECNIFVAIWRFFTGDWIIPFDMNPRYAREYFRRKHYSPEEFEVIRNATMYAVNSFFSKSSSVSYYMCELDFVIYGVHCRKELDVLRNSNRFIKSENEAYCGYYTTYDFDDKDMQKIKQFMLKYLKEHNYT